MQIASLRVKGLWGADSKKGIEIDCFGKRTVIIGPNNAGKSINVRALRILSQLSSKASGALTLSSEDFNNGGSSAEITVGLRHCTSDYSGEHLGDRFREGEERRHRVKITHKGNNGFDVDRIPLAHTNVGWRPLFKTEKGGQSGRGSSDITTIVDASGAYHSNSATSEINKIADGQFLEINKALVFFDSIRSLTRPGSNAAIDGSTILRRLYDMQNLDQRAAEWISFRNSFRTLLNELLHRSGMPLINEISLTQPKSNPNSIPRMYFSSDVNPELPIFVENMGTGVSQAVIILAELILSRGKPRVIIAEEPEVNMHPGLLRRFMQIIDRFSDFQFVFTSHSSAILDSVTKDDAVYHFQQNAKGLCESKQVSAVAQQHALLDSLGMSGSSLLQANCVLWVEGPSDRLYLREMMLALDDSLVEGADYSFAYYGGAVLAHYTLGHSESEAVQQLDDAALVEMTKICRHSAVIMDRDAPPGQMPTEPRKLRILKSVDEDSTHRMAVITSQWEMENDYGNQRLHEGLKAIIANDHDISGMMPSGAAPYDEEVCNHLSLAGEPRTSLKKKINGKVALARAVIASGGIPRSDPAIPQYVKDVVAFIKTSRCIS